MAEAKSLLILERGIWRPDQVEVHLIVGKNGVHLYSGDLKTIEDNWQSILAENPKAFAGPTIRLIDRHHLGEKLILEVIPSNYKEGCILGWLGVAMVPITSDGFVALQGPVSSVAATIGGGIRVPGCTPTHTGVLNHTIQEMHEEFGVKVTEANLSVLGLVEVRPPTAKLHHGLIVKVKLPCTKDELQKYWEDAEDKWDGAEDKSGGELKFVGFGRVEDSMSVNLEEFGFPDAFNRQSLLILAIVLDSELGRDNYVTSWSKFTGWW